MHRAMAWRKCGCGHCDQKNCDRDRRIGIAARQNVERRLDIARSAISVATPPRRRPLNRRDSAGGSGPTAHRSITDSEPKRRKFLGIRLVLVGHPRWPRHIVRHRPRHASRVELIKSRKSWSHCRNLYFVLI